MAKAGDIAVSITLDGSSYSSAAGKVIALNKQIAKSAEELGSKTVSSMQASSAAIRSLENPFGNNLRAVERFISTIPGISNGLKVAFPVVGALALASVIAKTTGEVVKFIETQKKLPSAIKDGFSSVTLEAQASNNQLQLTNDRLQNEIDKLEGKPQNELAIALDEARIKADDLARSLDSDYEKITRLLKDNDVGVLGGLLGAFAGGNASTQGVNQNITNFQAQIRGRANDYADAVSAGDDAGAAESKKQLAGLRKNYKAYLSDTLKQFQSGELSEAGDPTANINLLKGATALEMQVEQRERLQEANAALEAGRQKAQQAKETKTLGAETARKAEEQQMRGFQDSFAKQRSDFTQTIGGTMPVAEEIAFWQKMQKATAEGSRNYLAIEKQIATEQEEQQKQNLEKRKSDHAAYEEQQKAEAEMNKELPEIYASLIKAENEVQDRAVEKNQKSFDSQAKLIEITDARATSMAAATLQVQIATAAISAHDAAIEEAAIHEAEYQNKMKMLLDERENIVAKPLSDPDEQSARLNENRARRGELTNAYDAQAISDRAQILNTSFESQWKLTLAQMASEFTDFGAELTGTFKQTIDGLNGEIIRLLTTRHTTGYDTRQQFKAVGKQAFSSLANVGLRGVEGSALKGLGLAGGGKADGSEQRPFHVVMAGAVGAASALASPIAALLKKSSGFFGSLVSAAASIPAFASGGPISANTMALVGERGPELVRFGSSGTVIPNNQISMGGDTHHHHYNIDARGSTSPMETKRIVMQALIGSKDSIIKASLHASRDYSRRRPSTARS